jgi:hypothetical protein
MQLAAPSEKRHHIPKASGKAPTALRKVPLDDGSALHVIPHAAGMWWYKRAAPKLGGLAVGQSTRGRPSGRESDSKYSRRVRSHVIGQNPIGELQDLNLIHRRVVAVAEEDARNPPMCIAGHNLSIMPQMQRARSRTRVSACSACTPVCPPPITKRALRAS